MKNKPVDDKAKIVPSDVSKTVPFDEWEYYAWFDDDLD